VPDKLEVVPGQGLVARFGYVTVWAGPQATPALQAHLVSEAQRLQQSLSGGDELANSIIAVLQRGDPEPASPFAVVGPGANGLTLFLHGPVQAWDNGRWLAPQPVPGWMVASISRPWPLIVIPYGSPVPPQSPQGNPFDLVTGAVPGAGFVLLRPQSATGPFASTGAQTPQPSVPVQGPGTASAAAPPGMPSVGGASPRLGGPPSTQLAPVDLRMVPAPSRPALALASPSLVERKAGWPQLQGLRCPNSHFNHPQSTTCPRCGQALSAGTPATGPRPALGLLLADDGSVWSLDRNCLIGAEPLSAPEVQAGLAFGLPLSAAGGHKMAPVQAEVRLRDWAVYLVDRGAGWGTFSQGPAEGTWSQLSPSEERELSDGSHISCGGRVLTYLSAWPAGRTR
jgi:hypothetical protein